MSPSIVSANDNMTEYVSVNSFDSDMVELYTTGTAPPSTISGPTADSCSEFSEFTFVTAPPTFNLNAALPDFTLESPFSHCTHPMSFDEYCSNTHSLLNSIGQSFFGQTDTLLNDVQQSSGFDNFPIRPLNLGSLDVQAQADTHPGSTQQPQAQAMGEPTSNPAAILGDSPAISDVVDTSTASIRSLIERMESSVGAILVGINTLTASDGTVNPQAINQPSPHRPARARRSVKMGPLGRQIREELKKLLGQHFMEESRVVPLEALDTFAALWTSQSNVTLQPACCDVEDFRVDLLGSPRSPWNQSASRVFYAHFIQTKSTPEDQRHLVQHCFFQRMKCLQAAYRKETTNIAARKAAATAKRRQSRRNSLFTKRVDIALQHPLLREHVCILNSLGVSGMSSDESDIEDEATGQVTRYLIHKPVWRAESLSSWLRVFDSLHVLSRKLSASGTRGSFPRLRVDSEIESTRGFVKGLPVTAYEPKWLESHIAASFHVGQTREEYSFTHHNQIFSYLRYRKM